MDLLSDHALCTVAAIVAAKDVLRGQERIRSNRLEERGARRLFEERLSSCEACQDVEFGAELASQQGGSGVEHIVGRLRSEVEAAVETSAGRRFRRQRRRCELQA